MGKKKKANRNKRIDAWADGKLSEDDLTDKEVLMIEKRLFKITCREALERRDVKVFAQHGTVQ